ncbi:MAG: hypothetical protein RLZ22_536 [Verrucomicrobiota bacterium]|jgi:hypothetical protein
MKISDYLKGPSHKREAEDLKCKLDELNGHYGNVYALAEKYGAMEVEDVRRLVEQEQASLEVVRQQVTATEHQLTCLREKLAELRSQVLVVEETLLLESFALYTPKFKLTASHEYKTRLDICRERQKKMIKGGTAATGNMEWTVNGSNVEGRKLVNDMMKLVIRSFNNECDSCVDNVKFDNIELGEKRIHQSFDACNKLGRVMSVRLAHEYLALKFDELRLAHEYQVKKQEEKEEAKRVRQELREQAKLEQEIRAAREKIAKERKHFTTALRDLSLRLERASSEEERSALLVKISDVEAGRAALDNEEKLIDYREQNAKAGYVYVISNIGAFGEGIYKIGMTRRLEPMDRIDELGDASVPFWFDVHALVFSENAPALEAKLHEHFASGRLNKVNGRKEFFRADIEEIEEVIRANYDAVVEVTREAAAEQYRESLRMTAPTPQIQYAEHAASHA